MNTKYDIGDCLEVKNNYCDYVFCSNIIEINVDRNNNIIYKLANEKYVAEIPKTDDKDVIIGKVGHLSTI